MQRAIGLALSSAVALGVAGFGSSSALGVVTTYTFTGMVSQLTAAGNVVGVQGVVGMPITGSFSVDESLAFITSPTGTNASPLQGVPGVLQVTLAGRTFSTNIDQMTLDQQSPAGVNVVSAFTVAFNLNLDNVPISGSPRASMAVLFAFPSASSVPLGAMTGLSSPDFTHPQSYGVILEDAGNNPENAIRFTFNSFQGVPAPGAAGLLVLGGVAATRRRR